jgi:hypothetical protein
MKHESAKPIATIEMNFRIRSLPATEKKSPDGAQPAALGRDGAEPQVLLRAKISWTPGTGVVECSRQGNRNR